MRFNGTKSRREYQLPTEHMDSTGTRRDLGGSNFVISVDETVGYSFDYVTGLGKLDRTAHKVIYFIATLQPLLIDWLNETKFCGKTDWAPTPIPVYTNYQELSPETFSKCGFDHDLKVPIRETFKVSGDVSALGPRGMKVNFNLVNKGNLEKGNRHEPSPETQFGLVSISPVYGNISAPGTPVKWIGE